MHREGELFGPLPIASCLSMPLVLLGTSIGTMLSQILLPHALRWLGLATSSRGAAPVAASYQGAAPYAAR